MSQPSSEIVLTAEQIAEILSKLSNSSALYCAYTNKFMMHPVLDGQVDAQWIHDHQSNPIFQSKLPPIGTQLVKSRFGSEQFPVSHLHIIQSVNGEHELIEHLHSVIRHRDQLLVLNEQKMVQAGGRIKELTEQVEELKKTNEGYYTTIQSMALGMKAIGEQRDEAAAILEQLEQKMRKKEEELKIVRETGKVLGEQVEIWKVQVEEVNKVNKELEVKNQSLLEALSVPRVPEESAVIIEQLESTIRRLSAPPTPPIVMREDKENVPMLIPVVEGSKEVNKLLEHHGLQTYKKDFKTNGLSLFEAVSHQILLKYRRMKTAPEVLAELLAYFNEPDNQLLFHEQVKSTQNNEEPNWQLFLEFIKVGGVSDCIVEALAKCLGVHIQVFTITGINDFKGADISSSEPLQIAFFGGHAPFYVSTEKIEFIQID